VGSPVVDSTPQHTDGLEQNNDPAVRSCRGPSSGLVGAGRRSKPVSRPKVVMFYNSLTPTKDGSAASDDP